jgi:hypothetical protein
MVLGEPDEKMCAATADGSRELPVNAISVDDA